MIEHTMILSFTEPVPETELDQFLSDMEALVVGSGAAENFSSCRHIRVPADDHAPVFAATAIVRMTCADLDALNASFTLPGLEEFIGAWQSRFPYRVVWANHEPLD